MRSCSKLPTRRYQRGGEEWTGHAMRSVMPSATRHSGIWSKVAKQISRGRSTHDTCAAEMQNAEWAYIKEKRKYAPWRRRESKWWPGLVDRSRTWSEIWHMLKVWETLGWLVYICMLALCISFLISIPFLGIPNVLQLLYPCQIDTTLFLLCI
jgi:hypothetical protein